MNIVHEKVEKLSKFVFMGHTVPFTWYKRITFDNGKPHTPAISILSDILYWHRSKVELDPYTGAIIGYKKRFKEDLLQRSYAQFESYFGYSEKQIRAALIKLEDLGLIKREFRTITERGSRYNNVMYIDIDPDKIIEISTPPSEWVDDDPGKHLFPPRETGVFTSRETGVSIEGNTNTKITTKITNKKIDSKKEKQASKMIEVWEEIVLSNKKSLELTPVRQKKLDALLEQRFKGDLEKWKEFCQLVVSSPFLNGKNERGWCANLDWCIKPENFVKIREGAYTCEEKPSSTRYLNDNQKKHEPAAVVVTTFGREEFKSEDRAPSEIGNEWFDVLLKGKN